MNIGDRVRCTPDSIQPVSNGRNVLFPPQPGTVIYVHPKGRFFVVQFDSGFSEAFSFFDVE